MQGVPARDRGWNKMGCEVPSIPKHSGILEFHTGIQAGNTRAAIQGSLFQAGCDAMRIYRQPSKQERKDRNPCFEIASRAGFIGIFYEGSCKVFKKQRFSYSWSLSWSEMGFVVLPLISRAQVMNSVIPVPLFGMNSVIPAPLFGMGWQW